MDASRIRELREDHDLTQMYVSKHVGVTRPAYSLWESGLNNVPINYLYKLSNFYNVSIDYLLRLSDNKETVYKNDNFDIHKLSSNLKKIRMQNGLTQEAVSKILNVTQAAANKYEAGNILISTNRLIVFCKKFNVSLDDICH